MAENRRNPVAQNERRHDPDVVYINDSSGNLSRKGFGAMIAGMVTGAASFFGAEYWVRDKMRGFDSEVATLTREDIMKRTNAGVAGIGAGLDASLGEHVIQQKHTLDLVNKTENKLARTIYNLGGKSGFVLVVSSAVAAVTALIAYLVIQDKKEAVRVTAYNDSRPTSFPPSFNEPSQRKNSEERANETRSAQTMDEYDDRRQSSNDQAQNRDPQPNTAQRSRSDKPAKEWTEKMDDAAITEDKTAAALR